MKRILLVLVVFILLEFPSNVKADIAPPEQPPGSNPVPGSEITQVRMLTETVLIDVLGNTPVNVGGQATVTANFTMKNLGTTDETMKVRFPTSAFDGWGNLLEVSNFQACVDGKRVSTQKITGKDPKYPYTGDVPWTEFSVTFPADKEVKIQVSYFVTASEAAPFIWFTYIFSTGAAWKDTIGSADLTVKLPYDANIQNVVLSSTEEYTGTSPGGVFSGHEVKWHYTDFEPTWQNDFKIELVSPAFWQNVLRQQAYLVQHPKDGESWGIQAKYYKQMCFSPKGRAFRLYGAEFDAGAQELCQLSREAYEKAVTLKPEDPLWHAGFADLLGYYAYYAKYFGFETTADAQQALREIQKALELAPNDSKVQEIAGEISWFFPDGMILNGNTYEYPWLTASPVPPTPTIDINTPSPTETSEPSATPTMQLTLQEEHPTLTVTPATEETEKPNKPSLPFCGSLLLIPFGIVLLLKKILV